MNQMTNVCPRVGMIDVRAACRVEFCKVIFPLLITQVHHALPGEDHSVTYSYNLNFAGRRLVSDTRDDSGKVIVGRGLGVFKMATGATDNSIHGLQMRGSNEFQIKRGRSFNEIFYTTAEYDSTAETAAGNTSWFNEWKTGVTNGTRIYTPSTLPTFVTDHTWNKELEKTSNYVFRTDLRPANEMENKNYFSNNKNPFLQKYLSYKLMDASGTSITSGKNFGIKVQKPSQNKTQPPINITSFDSYLYCKKMDSIPSCPVDKNENFIGDGTSTLFTLIETPLKAPKITVNGTVLNTGFTWIPGSKDITFSEAPESNAAISISYVYDSLCPAGTINFSIKNSRGANVTIIAGASRIHSQYTNGNPAVERPVADSEESTASIISIYDKDTCINGTYEIDPGEPDHTVTVAKFDPNKPSYSTFIPLLGTKKEDFRYFDYDYSNGRVNPSATLSTDEKYLGVDRSGHNEILYAHTFKIPKAGDYFIYSPTGNTKLYYVCAQGQDVGEIGDSPSNYSGDNAIANVDFVRSVPGDAIYSTIAQARYHLNFKAYWSNGAGSLTITDRNETTTSPINIVSTPNLESIIIWNNTVGQSIYYNNVERTENFITQGGS